MDMYPTKIKIVIKGAYSGFESKKQLHQWSLKGDMHQTKIKIVKKAA